MGVRNSNKEKNNIQYRTYYRNGINLDKSNKKTLTDLILDNKQISKDMTESQDKITPTTSECVNKQMEIIKIMNQNGQEIH